MRGWRMDEWMDGWRKGWVARKVRVDEWMNRLMDRLCGLCGALVSGPTSGMGDSHSDLEASWDAGRNSGLAPRRPKFFSWPCSCPCMVLWWPPYPSRLFLFVGCKAGSGFVG